MSAGKPSNRMPHGWQAVLLLAIPLACITAWLGSGHGGALGPARAEAAWTPQHPSERWECIVIHHSGSDFGGAQRFGQWHRARGWDELGYHFVIGNGTDTPDGFVEVGPRWVEQKHGAHCKTDDEYYNQHGIGICLVGNFDHYHPTAAQMKSLARLVRFLCQHFDIPPTDIYTHGGITGKTDCPGKEFDVDELRRMVSSGR